MVIKDDSDEFWSLESMLPRKKSPAPPSANTITTAEIEIPGDDITSADQSKTEPIIQKYPPITKKTSKEGRLSFEQWLKQRNEYEKERSASSKILLMQYKPENPLIKEVRISAYKSLNRSGERFISDGYKYASLSLPFEANVPFESIYPQFAAMTQAQIKCYIGFRTEIKNGRFPKVDRAYIYLFLYELINLSNVYSVSDKIKYITALINGYPDCDDRLFADMCNWLCDICLINKLPAPSNELNGCIHRIIKLASLKEFFIVSNNKNDIYPLVYAAGRYNFRQSKYYPPFKKLFEEHIENSVCLALKKLAENNKKLLDFENDICTLSHESYFGALCTAAVRRTVEADCYCITRSDTLKRTVTELIKYSENCLRSRLGISQRLTVNTLSLDIKSFLKDYYTANVPYSIPGKTPKKLPSPTQDVPDYEKLYEPATTGLDTDLAMKIESSSWEITQQLISAFESEEYQDDQQNDTCAQDALTEESDTAPSYPQHVIRAANALLKGDMAAFTREAKENNMLPSAYADMINEAFFDEIGDNVLDNDGINISVSEYYTDELEELIKKFD